MAYYKVIQSGSQVEVYEFALTPSNKGYVKPRVKKSEEDRRRLKRLRANLPRRASSIRRARDAFRRIVLANISGESHPVLATFTMYEVVPLKVAWKRFEEFSARLRRKYGRRYRIIVVPEFQKRGAVHFHSLVWDLAPEIGCVGQFVGYGSKRRFIEKCSPERKCERSTRNLQRAWLWGFCDCIETDGSVKLAGYLSKYMSKAMSDPRLRGARSYSASRNVLRPMSVSGSSIGAYLEEIVGVDNLPLHTREFDTKYLGRSSYKRYKVT